MIYSVALNYQDKSGYEMLQNISKFRANKNSGYVLKPKYLRHRKRKNGTLIPPSFSVHDISTWPIRNRSKT